MIQNNGRETTAEAFNKFIEAVKKALEKLSLFCELHQEPFQQYFYRKKGYPLGRSIRGRKKFIKRYLRKL